MIKIAIVEDDINEQKNIVKYLEESASVNKIAIQVKTYSNGEQFLFDFSYGAFNLIFMDIELSSTLNGMQTSEKLREIDEDVSIIFVTSLAQFAIDGYRVNAIDYIVKPIDHENFISRVVPVLSNLENKISDKIIITSEGSKIVIKINDIYYVEISNHQLIFHTKKGDIKSYGSLKDYKGILVDRGFSLCNSCFLVNLEYVERIEGYSVFVKGDELAISHPKRKTFLKELSLHLGR